MREISALDYFGEVTEVTAEITRIPIADPEKCDDSIAERGSLNRSQRNFDRIFPIIRSSSASDAILA